MSRLAVALGSVTLLAVLCSAQVSTPITWQELDPENVLSIQTTKGTILVEMRPDMAPEAVARVKLLARERVYDGLQFHRVVEHFVVQTGNPNNRDGGTSNHPNLPPEFMFRLKPGSGEIIATRTSDGVSGLLGSVPFQGAAMAEAMRAADGRLRAWGAYCRGVAGMGRQQARDSANSEIFFMLEASRRLDRDYTVWGRVIDGFPSLLSLAIGEPPARPDLMTKVQVLSDVPAAERPRVSLPSQADLATIVQQVRQTKAADFAICDVIVPTRITRP